MINRLFIVLSVILIVACQGNDGDDGEDKTISRAAYCEDIIEDLNIGWTYYIWVFDNDDIFVTGTLFNTGYQVSNSRFYKDGTQGNADGRLWLRWDVWGYNNNGNWYMRINKDFFAVSITYEDEDLEESPLFFGYDLAVCEVYNY